MFAASCANIGGDGGSGGTSGGLNGNGGGAGASSTDVAGDAIVNVAGATPIQISELEEPLSILYRVSAPSGALVSSFYEQVERDTLQPVVGSEPTTIATLLPVGEGQFFFNPAQAGVGYYRVGLTILDASGEQTIISEGVIHVQGPPNPVFRFPTADMTVRLGEDINIHFDIQDPEGDNVHWRVFYLRESDSRTVSAEKLGVRIESPGTGNIGQRRFETANLKVGEYQIGISASDVGDSIATAATSGDAHRIVTVFGPTITVVELTPRPPDIKVVKPGANAVELFSDQTYTIEVRATVSEPGAIGVVEVFYDHDNDFNRGFAGVIGTASISASTSGEGANSLLFPLPEGLEEGTYYIGAMISDGINPIAVDYAASTITIVRRPALVVTAPDLSMPVPTSDPDDPSSGIRVEWTTNVPSSGGIVDVFAQAVDKDGNPMQSEQPIAHSGDTRITSAVFFPETSGVFRVSVRITLTDVPSDLDALDWCDSGVCVKTAPQLVRVTALPPTLWLGSLAQDDPPFDGAVFRGIHEEDNTGSSFARAGDLDGDGLQDFVIGARYGKSVLADPAQVIGPGEAYIIYGASGESRLVGVYDLRFVGSSLLRGVLVTGLQTVGGSAETDGLAAITLLPDADGDDRGELAFGFPRTDSACLNVGPLCSDGQFLNGGVVILSSDNGILRDPTSGFPEIDSGAVGQLFDDMTRTDRTDMLQDLLEFPEDDPGAEFCQEGSDGVSDTVLGPAEGFIEMLAWDMEGFTPIPPGTSIGIGVCVTEYDVPTCEDASGEVVFGGEIVGSGFYPADALAEEPKGARIIGPAKNAGFGASITVIGASEDHPVAQLVISAPNRKGLASEVDGLMSDITGAGVSYVQPSRNLWTDMCLDGTTLEETDCDEQPDVDELPLIVISPPTPHQYVMGVSSHCGTDRSDPLDPQRVVGQSGEKIQNILAIKDFDGNGRDDIAVGVPTANDGDGRVYIILRDQGQGDYVLDNLELDPSNPNRFAGVVITGGSVGGLGASLASDVDFNGDGVSDLIIGSPGANNGGGEVIIVFGDPNLESPPGGLTVETLLMIRGAGGKVRAARIIGDTTNSEQTWFGYNVANAGDVDGDGFDDLLIAAPNATPRFDPDPTDGVDVASSLGVDMDFDGQQDDVSGPNGVPDGKTDDYDDLRHAGLVYLVFGGSRLDQLPSVDRTIAIDELGSDALRGLLIAGQAAGDRIGGGDAGDVAQGGHSSKNGRGRSQGLSGAGDVDGDGRADILIGSVLAERRESSDPEDTLQNAGESYLIYSTSLVK